MISSLLSEALGYTLYYCTHLTIHTMATLDSLSLTQTHRQIYLITN